MEEGDAHHVGGGVMEEGDAHYVGGGGMDGWKSASSSHTHCCLALTPLCTHTAAWP